jgi:mycothiol synthase
MLELTTHDRLTPDDVDAVRALVARVAAELGGRPLSDEHWLAMTTQASNVVTEVTAHASDRLAGFGQAVRGNDAYSVEIVTERDAPVGPVLTATLDALRAAGGRGPVHFWVSAPSAEADRTARAAGLDPVRRLLQMRRPLPTGWPVEVTTRAFRPGEDDEAWLAVNNRAFAGHPEQGNWTREALARREAEPWFEPAGFRLHERDGRLAAFCWTKLHRDADPVLGEIYVIGVDPDFQGLGLGRQLTLAGLASIAERGVDVGMLYVDEANTGALALYERLGFDVHHVDVAYGTELGSPS